MEGKGCFRYGNCTCKAMETQEHYRRSPVGGSERTVLGFRGEIQKADQKPSVVGYAQEFEFSCCKWLGSTGGF